MNKKIKKYSRKNWFLFLAFCNLLIIILLYLNYNPIQPEIGLDKNIDKYGEYALSPIYNNAFIDEVVIDYPHVQIAPYDLRYFYIPYKEYKDLKNGKYDNIFFAEKRISELLTWGETLKSGENEAASIMSLVYSDTKEDLVASGLKNWWENGKSKKLNSWEATFARYLILMEEKENKLIKNSNTIDNSQEINNFIARINKHYSDIEKKINKASLPERKIRYLASLNKKIYKHLDKKIKNEFPFFDSNIVYYPLSNIIKDKKYGVYDILVKNTGTDLNLKRNIKLTLGGKNYLYPNNRTSDNEDVYKDVIISDSNKSLSTFKDFKITSSTINLAENYTNWKKIKNDKRYYLDIFAFQPKNLYYLKFKAKISEPVKVIVEYVYETEYKKHKQLRYDILLNKYLEPSNGQFQSFEQLLRTSNEKLSRVRFVIESTKFPFNTDLQLVDIELRPISAPTIILKKVNSDSIKKPQVSINKITSRKYLAIFKNTTTATEDDSLRKIEHAWKIVDDRTYKIGLNTYREVTITNKTFPTLLFSIIYLNLFLFGFLLFPRAISILGQIQLQLTKTLIDFCSKTKYLFLALVVIGLLIDILFVKSYTDLTTAFLTISWIIVLIGFKVESLTSFNIGLLFLVLTPFFLLAHLDYIGDKFGIWAFEFIVIGSIQAVYEIRAKKSLYNPFKIFYKPIQSHLSNLEFLFNLFIDKGSYLIQKIFILHPKTFRDYLKNILVVFILILIISVTGILSNKAYKLALSHIAALQDKKNHESRLPEIKKIEPNIAYHSNRVIVSGRSFGLEQTDKAKLILDDIVVSAYIWTNSTIVFAIPLHWKVGEHEIWVERKIDWKGKTYIVRSNKTKFKLLPITGRFTKEDAEYFKQLKSLDKEALRINGYDPKDYK